jgi:hypothetical protein
MTERRIAIIGGTGEQGFGIALRLAKAGEKIILGSRQEQKALEAAKRANAILGPNASVTGMENSKATAAADIIIMSVPFLAHAETIKSILESVTPEDIFIDAVVPLSTAVGGSAMTTLEVWEGSAAQQAARLLHNHTTKIASAFHNVVAEALQDLKHNIDCDVLVCGDSLATRKIAMELVNKLPGVRAIDCGRLENSRIVETVTAMLIGFNLRYQVNRAGLRITGLDAVKL